MKIIFILVLASLLLACDKTPKEALVTGRWYSQSQLDSGNTLFQKHCAKCHGKQAQGLIANWKKPLADKSYPPPPLNGTAHAWHHPVSVLLTSIQLGGAPYNGKMPPFKDTLTKDEQLATIAFFQSHWPEKIYSEWLKMGGIDN